MRRLSPRRVGLRYRVQESRGGAVTVELALVLPFLVILVLGLIDVSQYLVAEEVVNRASAIGALQAADATTINVSDVSQVVQDQVQEAYPNLLSADLQDKLQVVLTDGLNQPLSGNALANMASGDEVVVDVTFSYDAVRWLNGFPGLDNQSLNTRTVVRRD